MVLCGFIGRKEEKRLCMRDLFWRLLTLQAAGPQLENKPFVLHLAEDDNIYI